MTDITIPEEAIAEAWSEFVYPRPAVGDLSDPHPHSGFMRAIHALNTRLPVIVAAELERIADEISDDHKPPPHPYWVERNDDGSVSADMVRQIDRIEARAAELRGVGSHEAPTGGAE